MTISINSIALVALGEHLSGLGLGYDIAQPGIDYPDSDSSKAGTFLQVDFIPNGSIDYAIGEEEEHVQGLFQVTVLTPLGQGSIAGHDIAGQIKEHFSKDTRLWRDGCRIDVQRTPDATGPITDDDRLRFPVSIYFECRKQES